MRGVAELRQYYRAVVRRAWLVALLVVLAAGGMYVRTRAAGPKYGATTTIIVTAPVVQGTPQVTTTGGFTQGQLPPPNLGVIINDIANLLRARPVVEPLAEQSGLSEAKVRSAISASRIRDTDLVTIRAVTDDPQQSADLANASATQLIRYFRELSRQDMHEVRLFIEGQMAQLQGRLDASDRRILAYKQQHGILDIDQEISQAMTAASTLRTDQDNTMIELREIDAKLAAAQRRLAGEPQMRLISGTLKDNPLFQQYQTRLGDLELQRATLSQTYTERHPKMKQVEGEIAAVRRQMLATAKKVVDSEVSGTNPVHDQLLGQIVTLQVDRAAAQAHLQALGVLISRRQADRLRLPRTAVGLEQLVRENTVLAETHASLFEDYQDALVKENQAGYLRAALSVMEAAVPPVQSQGSLPKRLSIAGLFGLVLGLMAAVLLDVSEDRIRSAQEAEGVVGAPVLASVPDVAPQGTPAGTFVLMAIVLAILLGAMAPTITPLIARLAVSIEGALLTIKSALVAIEGALVTPVASTLHHQAAAVLSWIR